MKRSGTVTFALVVLAACSSGDGSDQAGGTTTAASTTATTSATDTSATALPVTTSAPGPEAIPAKPSAGCGTSTGGPGRLEGAFPVDDFEWTWVAELPTSYSSDVPMPVVIGFRGAGEPVDHFEAMSGLPKVGEEKGFISVFPSGTFGILAPIDVLGSHAMAVRTLLDELGATACLDENRVFATGISMGGFFSSFIGCALSDRVAAIAPIAGSFVPEDCALTRPVPEVVFHGTEDHNVFYLGAENQPILEMQVPIPETAAAWAEMNGCAATTSEETIGSDVTVIAWDCPSGQDVVLYRLEGGGHTWPGDHSVLPGSDPGAVINMTIDATEVMWDFFVQHPMTPS